MALDAGAEDATEDDGEIVVYTDMKDLHKVRAALADNGLKVTDANLEYVANTPVEISDPTVAQKALNLLDLLDELDDITAVHTNADITADV
jgi:transcriptional/translational regulatory protein YebC/TACO1